LESRIARTVIVVSLKPIAPFEQRDLCSVDRSTVGASLLQRIDKGTNKLASPCLAQNAMMNEIRVGRKQRSAAMRSVSR
jgi:hypothetical protein